MARLRNITFLFLFVVQPKVWAEDADLAAFKKDILKSSSANYLPIPPSKVSKVPWYVQNANWQGLGFAPESFYRAIRTGSSDFISDSDQAMIGVENSGLGEHFHSQILNGPCLGKLTQSFYKSLGMSSSNGGDAPTMAAQSGVDYPPGWLWKKAMSASNGNANLASFLIGACGHDDVLQAGLAHGGDYHVNNTSTEAMAEKEMILIAEISKLQSTIKGFEVERILLDSSDPTYKTLEGKVDFVRKRIQTLREAMTDRKTGHLEEIRCPDQGSEFFKPKALGEQVDLTPEQKKLIAKMEQGRTPEQLPAKTYHIYGANYLSCLLKRDGTAPLAIPAIQDALATVYRSTRTCGLINEMAYQSDNQWLQYRKWNQLFPADSGMSAASAELPDDPIRHISLTQHLAQTIKKRPPGKVSETFLRRQIEASIVFRYATIGPRTESQEKVPLAGLDCTDLKLSPDTAANFQKPEFREDHCKQFHIDTVDCDAVMNMVVSWHADMEWTRAQHKLGAEFAAQNCQPSKQTTDQMACDALAAQPAMAAQASGVKSDK